jgi:hypothetical protein
MSFDRKAAVALGFCDELDDLADWIDEQEPGFVAPLTAEQKSHWRFARDAGLEVPEEIAAQL